MILSILKVIGIVLLIILTLIIFILLLVLFSPIRYQFSGRLEDEPEGDISVKWAPVLLRITVTYHNKQLEYVIRLIGGVVMTNTPAKISWIGRKFFSFGESEKEVDEDTEHVEEKSLSDSEKSFQDVSSEKESLKEEIERQTAKKAENTRKISRKRRRKKTSFVNRIQKKIRNLQRKIREIIHTLKNMNQKREALSRVYHSKRFQQVKVDLKKYAGEIFRILKPDRLEGNVRFGLEDPANTGYILGILAMLLPVYQGFLTIEPDFTQQILKGCLQGKGKIRLIFVVKLVIKVILNKNLIKVTKKVQTILEA
ncbi:MAG: DUF2953 domain-containing protein [Clostridiales bacterium]|nr:DUF2953 domain-containing protein [Clostridiales bacterium]